MSLVFTHMPDESNSTNTRYINSTRGCVPLVEFMDLLFTCMPGQSYRRQLRSLLLYLCYVFQLNPLCVDSARVLWASFCFKIVTKM